MGLFKGQSSTQIKLDTGTNVTGATAKKILFEKPDGTKGEWDAEIEGTTILTYQLADGNIDQVGNWKFQSYVEIGGGKKGFGAIVTEFVQEALK